MVVRILVGDCRERLRGFSEGYFHCVVTSPPYWGLRDYGIPPVVWGGEEGCEHVWGEDIQQGMFCQHCGAWRGCLGLEPTVELYVEHLVECFREVRRVLREDGTAWVNLGDSYAGSWGNYGAREGKQRNRNAERWHRAAYEGEQGWDGLPPTANVPGLKAKDLIGVPWRVALALQADGWWLRSDIIWSKPNSMPESVKDRPTRSHEYLFLLAKSGRYYYDADAIREPHKEASYHRQERARGAMHKNINGAPGQPSHTLHRPRPNIKGLRTALETLDEGQGLHPAGRNKRTVWRIPTHGYPGAHFATFPPALVEPCIQAGTSEGGACPRCGAPWERIVEREFVPQRDTDENIRGHGETKKQPWGWDGFPRGINQVTTTGWKPTCDCPECISPMPCRVLDPFGGAGTVGMVVDRLGRDCVLIEIKGEYAEMARRRIAEDAGPMFARVVVEKGGQ